KILNSASRLRTVVRFGGDLHLAHGVAFGAEVGHKVSWYSPSSRYAGERVEERGKSVIKKLRCLPWGAPSPSPLALSPEYRGEGETSRYAITLFSAAAHSFSAGTGFSTSPSYSMTNGPLKFDCLSTPMNFGRSRFPWPMMTSFG